ncbi:MAG: response regulator [bacterium]|nr:response regulator [bacterium]
MSYDILLVDDSNAALFMFKKIINLSGAPINRVLTAENGQLGIDVLKENHVDLIMSDINMPVMDGFQFVEYLKSSKEFSHIPIIMITTEGRDKYVLKAKQLGAADYVKKPFLPEQIKQIIRETLGFEKIESDDEELEGEDF